MIQADQNTYIHTYAVKEQSKNRDIIHRFTLVDDNIIVNYNKDGEEIGIIFLILGDKVYNKNGSFIGRISNDNKGWYKLKLNDFGKYKGQMYMLSDTQKHSAFNKILMEIIKNGNLTDIINRKL